MKYFFLILFSVCTFMLHAQPFKQNVRGIVKDNFTGLPLENVNVILTNDTVHTGTTTDKNGAFLIENIPIGYYDLTFSIIGYETQEFTRIRLISSREFYIVVEMNSSIELLEEATIVSSVRKDRPNNPRAMVSSRSFTLEEANKYAGSYGDPARMAINYAGVLPARDNRNDIIIRGNTSNGLQWRLDDIEIPNPNHFGAIGSSGGPITIINNNLLRTSDFFTGAFPAQYSNATAGVFDLKMKPGNPDNNNHWAQLGWNGIEIGSEGPLYKEENLTYAAAYRYSFVDLLSKLIPRLPDAVTYQDLSLKLNWTNTSMGNFSLTAIGGTSNISIRDSDEKTENWLFENSGEDVENAYQMGAIGLTHSYLTKSSTMLTNTISLTGYKVENFIDTFTVDNPDPFLWAHERSEEIKASLSSSLKHRFSSKVNASIGVYADAFSVSFVDSQYINNSYNHVINSKDQQMYLYRLYSDVSYRMRSNLRSYFGVNLQHFEFTGENIIEPRLGLQWDISDSHSISYGSGLHSQIQPMMMYFVISELDDEKVLTNRDLEFTKSLHNVLGYDYLINPDLRLKLETYYQYIYNAPVSLSEPAYSLLNYGAEFYIERMDSLVNEGTGRNYGIELTLEKFWSRNYYFLITGSIFDSKYTGKDGIERNTAFNGNFAINVLAGYELRGQNHNRSMNLGINFTYAGGRPYVPYDIDSSIQNREVKLLWERAYQVQRENYKRFSFRIGFRQNFKKLSIETAIDLQYRTDYTSIYYDRLDLETGDIVKTFSMGFYPMGTININF